MLPSDVMAATAQHTCKQHSRSHSQTIKQQQSSSGLPHAIMILVAAQCELTRPFLCADLVSTAP